MISLDHTGLAQVLKLPGMAQLVHGKAEEIAGNVRQERPGDDVAVDDYTTDRAASSVTIREPYGRLLQVRDGVLTRAASVAGVEVHEQ